MHRPLASSLLLTFICLLPSQSSAQIDARMLRYPAVSQTHIAFVYAGDIWTVPRAGGTAVRLSSPLGEEAFPRFSPDGSKIAFSAEYDGNLDVYVIPATGGEPVRLTHHPMPDRVVGWTPDGTRVLFASSRESGRQRYSQFFTVGLDGGLPEKLPVPYGEFGAYSPDGSQFVYMPVSQDFRTWKRYRGGWAPDLWLFNLKTLASRKLTEHPGNDAQPMWHGTTLYFLSDRGDEARNNLWAQPIEGGQARRLTNFKEFDITFPSLGPDAVVFQAGGRLHLFDMKAQQAREVPIRVVTDESTLRTRMAKGEPYITGASVSPSGKRGVFNVRGDVVTVPAEHGAILNVTRSTGVAERYPRWSPDGMRIAYWSDRSGEYELTVRPADGSGEERKLTSMGKGYRYPPHWSPDSKRVVFADQSMKVYLFDLEANTLTQIDQSPWWIGHGGLEAWRFSWSPDSRWVAYGRPADQSGNNAIFAYDVREGRRTQLTSGYLNEDNPTFDPEGKFLYYTSDRTFDPIYGSFDNSWTYANPTRLIATPLRKDVKSPLHARNDAESAKTDTGDKPEDTDKKDPKEQEKEGAKPETQKEATAKPEPPPQVTIDVDGFEQRAIVLPPPAGNYADVQAVKGKLLYRRLPRAGSGSGQRSPILYFDFAAREEKQVLDAADGVEVSHDGSTLFVLSQGRYAMFAIRPDQKFDKPMPVGDIEVPVNPRAEWRQMFMDTYRVQRDFFYDPNLHGVDWDGLSDRYGKLLEDAVTRWDVDFVLGEFIAELNASHTYRSGGDVERAPARTVGMLGVDWELSTDAYRIKTIIRGGPWDTDVRSPLDDPGVDVKAGEFVLAVNGVRIDPQQDPWAAFQGLGNKTIVLTVSEAATGGKERQVVVRTLSDETELRFRAWIEERRQIVDKATGGKVGYIYVQSTGVPAQNELVRQFMGQWRKQGLVIDERWNSGGQIPDRFIELLNRPILAYWGVRDGKSWQWPPVAHRGAQVMLINGWSGSGGDAFPTYFRQAGLGPLIGTRTWGGLIGVSGSPDLVDGGTVTVPTFRMYDPQGKWFAEGHGVEPDIHVPEDPTALAKGTDPQLERAIKEVQDLMAKLPPAPPRPGYEKR